MPELTCGRLICKRKHPAPNINSVDLNFGEEFNHTIHGPELNECLSISHLILVQQSTLKSLNWRIFSKKGVTVPIKDYKCEINSFGAMARIRSQFL